MEGLLHSAPFLTNTTTALLVFVVLLSALSSRVNTNKLGQAIGFLALWIIVVSVTVLVEYQLHQVRPSLLDGRWNGTDWLQPVSMFISLLLINRVTFFLARLFKRQR